MSNIFPAIFFGHGNPMNALQNNPYTAAWRRIGEAMPKPRAILAISAHWSLPMSAVTINTAPRTIHDFGGFPPELYKVQYPAPGDPELAARVRQLLAPLPVVFDDSWGLDHGTWSVLTHVYPRANIPVVQLSINEARASAEHFEIGRRLAKLRTEDVLLVGSGNLVHNLHTYAWGQHKPAAYDWATRFENTARNLMRAQDNAPLIDYESLGRDAMLSVPTPEHYLPLLYVLGARHASDKLTFPVEGVDGGSISMLSVQLSAQ